MGPTFGTSSIFGFGGLIDGYGEVWVQVSVDDLDR